jgi:TATA-box binding protein (TBP) (component of TFIID and TFIIIB)
MLPDTMICFTTQIENNIHPSMDIPTSAPVPAPLKLVTMTIDMRLDRYLNLDVIAKHVPLSEPHQRGIIGVRFRDIRRGQHIKPSDNGPANIGSGRFKNQCTFIVNIGDKNINTKVFNNGEIVNVGCKATEHAIQSAHYITSSIHGLSGPVTYQTPDSFRNKNIKKFYKDELYRKYAAIIRRLVETLGIALDTSMFAPDINLDDGYVAFSAAIKDGARAYCYVYCIISIIKTYYSDEDLHAALDSDIVKRLLDGVRGREPHDITGIFPAYVGHGEIIPVNPAWAKTVLINKSTNCGYFLRRSALLERLNQEPAIVNCTFDKGRYPGVIAVYRNKDRGTDTKIIFFNTGKINITAARTHEQVQEAYDFIVSMCRDNFAELLLTSEYHNKSRRHEDSLPDQHYVGLVDEQHYYLLKKSSILANPRNIRVLKKMGILEKYSGS